MNANEFSSGIPHSFSFCSSIITFFSPFTFLDTMGLVPGVDGREANDGLGRRWGGWLGGRVGVRGLGGGLSI